MPPNLIMGQTGLIIVLSVLGHGQKMLILFCVLKDL